MAHIITDDCVKCGLCATECPKKAITEGEEKYIISSALCNDSGRCAEVCPVGAAKAN
ncbi:MAG: 4Fe-4S binding protein [Candidatus Omnitrophota bacterium]